MTYMRAKSVWALSGLLFATVTWTGCNQQAPPPAPPSVTVSRPATESVGDFIDLTGTVGASKSVDLMARVTGYLQSVNFQDGASVETGQLLFVIEPEPYEQQLKLALAALVMAQAEYDRQLELNKQNATSVANVEKWLSQRDQADAQVELAKLNLSYTHITAPFGGRMSARQFDPGNLVGPSGKARLATIEELTPIYVNFNLNERDGLRIRELIRQQGKDPRSGVGKAPVLVGLQTEDDFPHEGTLDFVDLGVAASSGTIQMRAVFKNADLKLFPGLFARVRIPLGTPQPLLVVPDSAVGNDPEGDYVLVTDASNIVVRRAVVKGPLVKTGCAIRSGLAAEDRVIVNGLLRAKPGMTVLPITETAAPSPAR